ncbi:MAG: sigma-70 family RNA polymerase sigma factor [Alphaproteobacteria bacterium]
MSAKSLNGKARASHGAFEQGLIENMPGLRAFARRLAADHGRADDLVQTALMKAIANRRSFAMGTNLRAWLFTILKNAFLADLRRARWEIGVEDVTQHAQFARGPSQESSVRLNELDAALAVLPFDQREAVMMVGGEGFSYEEAAAKSGCAIGTMKSRVSRGRDTLKQIGI